MRALRHFVLALGFLTTLPVPGRRAFEEGSLRAAAAYYPLVGWVLGGLLALAAWALTPWPDGPAAGVVLALWLGLTGMLHLDGLLDSADALLAPRTPEERLRILRDVHHGTYAFGVGAVFLLLKWQAVLGATPALLLLAPVAARFWLLPLFGLFPSARAEGLGAAARPGPWSLGLLFALPAFVWAPLPFVFAGLWAFAAAGWAARRLGGLTGDVYGAVVETAELAFLLAGWLMGMA
ncbi:MAG TPA: adenosylcobinamide-GDP ribazoletransferase [Oceanithermus profundus]|uniref:Adenosylcobinamide-GDP ribazoletransferase n=1 Tax=Oceanithermus profundus TaxID=187137 RepID=A0A7C4ZIG4_9DEIN|nr:adenosylcobinamide-GDP ribazoletransferase [Oceanithermus profundus]